jgi:hypothetical protein
MASIMIERRILQAVSSRSATHGRDVHLAEAPEQLRIAGLLAGRQPTAWAELRMRGLLSPDRAVAGCEGDPFAYHAASR